MDITKRVRHDHAEIRSIAHRILGESPDATARDASFRDYDDEVRAHLDAFEDVFIGRMAEDRVAADAAHDIAAEHRAIRKTLRKLDRRGKDSQAWTDEFRQLSARFESLCHRHEALVNRTCSIHDSAQLDHDYETVKAKMSRRSRGGWGKALIGIGAMGALAGIGYFATREGSRERIRGLTGRVRSGSRDNDGVDVLVVENTVVEVLPIAVMDSPERPSRTPASSSAGMSSAMGQSAPSSAPSGMSKPTHPAPGATASSPSSASAPRTPAQTPPTDEHTTELTGSAHPSSDYNVSSSLASKDRI